MQLFYKQLIFFQNGTTFKKTVHLYLKPTPKDIDIKITIKKGIKIMIQSIYETHLHVRNLEKAIDFYQNKLGLALARKLSKRRVAFFWVGENKKQMLGLWEVHNIEVL